MYFLRAARRSRLAGVPASPLTRRDGQEGQEREEGPRSGEDGRQDGEEGVQALAEGGGERGRKAGWPPSSRVSCVAGTPVLGAGRGRAERARLCKPQPSILKEDT